MTDILLFGASGRLGRKLTAALGDRVVALSREDLDVTCSSVLSRIISYKPRIVINCTAFNNIDGARERPDKAFAVNTHAPTVMATAAWYTGSLFIHFSSDYAVTGDDPYSLSKLLGEQAIAAVRPNYIVLRLSSIYTSDDMAGALSPIAQWLNGAGRSHDNPIKVLHQITTPTSIRTVVSAVQRIIAQYDQHEEDYCEVFNLVDNIPVWKSEFSALALKLFLDVNTATISEGQLAIPRPVQSMLSNRLLCRRFNLELPAVITDLGIEARLWKNARDSAADGQSCAGNVSPTIVSSS